MAFDFRDTFRKLTGNSPFPWQEALYKRFETGRVPVSCSLPTGLGKTNVIAVWLIALINYIENVPRRLVYVVNRRTVVDQTTAEVERLRCNLEKLTEVPEHYRKLAISTLRGQFADNREWSADPSRPAVICGTVDMIGSRLLFSGYGVGFKAKPLHAGFLGQDSLVVHDEAHLEPAFQHLLLAIQAEQKRCGDFRPLHVLELTATSRGEAESFPDEGERLANEKDETVQRRIGASKALTLHEISDEKKELTARITELALTFKDSQKAILIFVRKVDDVATIVNALEEEKQQVQQLTGTIRGWERDALATSDEIFARFLPDPKCAKKPGTVYLVCTSAGEVGVNISADHLACDLTTFESMAQRFGRVNRFGAWSDTEIHVVYPSEPGDEQRRLTLGLLALLDGDGSPTALGKLWELAKLSKSATIEGQGGNEPSTDRIKALRKCVEAVQKHMQDHPGTDPRTAAFAPPPILLPTSDILFDAWALTSIREKLPARPSVEPYLHGVEDKTEFEAYFAWREEVELLTGHVSDEDLGELFGEFPLKSHEKLRVATFGKRRAYEQLEEMAQRSGDLPVWVIEPDGTLKSYAAISEIVQKTGNDYTVRLAGRTVVLPPQAGGLTVQGTLEGKEDFLDDRRYDVAGTPAKVLPQQEARNREAEEKEKSDAPIRLKVTPAADGTRFALVAPTDGWPNELPTAPAEKEPLAWLNQQLPEMGMPCVKASLRLDFALPGEDDDSEALPAQYWIVRGIRPQKKGEKAVAEWPALSRHLTGVARCAARLCENLKIDEEIAKAVVLAATWHDIGKARAVWQRGAGNCPENTPVAKTLHGRAPENLNRFRHELGSMIDLAAVPEFAQECSMLTTPHQEDLVLHLIATHHGRGRPHFSADETVDPDRPGSYVTEAALAAPGRFARLQHRYGRWGLAYLESLLRAADIMESRRIEAAPIAAPVQGTWAERSPNLLPLSVRSAPPRPSMRIKVDVTNPGQFFACCGLLELADRLWPGAEVVGSFSRPRFERSIFALSANKPFGLEQILEALLNCKQTAVDPYQPIRGSDGKPVKDAKKTKPVSLRSEANPNGEHLSLRLAWWLDELAGTQSRFKTWSAHNSSQGLILK